MLIGHLSIHNPVTEIVLYFPLSHRTHGPPFGLDRPLLHMITHMFQDVLSGGEN